METLTKNTTKTILFTKDEIEDTIFLLEEQIEDLESCDQDGTIKRMIKSRKDKIETLKGQDIIITKDAFTKGDNKLTLDLGEQTWTGKNHNHDLIFLTHRFKTGHFLGFWSHSPWGSTQDQEKGWGIIDPDTLELIEECETRSSGNWTGEFKEWRSQMGEKFGKATILKDDCGESKWKMLDT